MSETIATERTQELLTQLRSLNGSVSYKAAEFEGGRLRAVFSGVREIKARVVMTGEELDAVAGEVGNSSDMQDKEIFRAADMGRKMLVSARDYLNSPEHKRSQMKGLNPAP